MEVGLVTNGRWGAIDRAHVLSTHGAFCLGCCWALMLIMFGIGIGSLVWMAVLTGVMVIEKTMPFGQRLSPVIGIILLGLSALWLAHPGWLPLQDT